jgi:hypothetical protein
LPASSAGLQVDAIVLDVEGGACEAEFVDLDADFDWEIEKWDVLLLRFSRLRACLGFDALVSRLRAI